MSHIHDYTRAHIYPAVVSPAIFVSCMNESCNVYGVATVSRIDKITSLFCRIQSLLQGSFAIETYNVIDPTNRSHPITKCVLSLKPLLLDKVCLVAYARIQVMCVPVWCRVPQCVQRVALCCSVSAPIHVTPLSIMPCLVSPVTPYGSMINVTLRVMHVALRVMSYTMCKLKVSRLLQTEIPRKSGLFYTQIPERIWKQHPSCFEELVCAYTHDMFVRDCQSVCMHVCVCVYVQPMISLNYSCEWRGGGDGQRGN